MKLLFFLTLIFTFFFCPNSNSQDIIIGIKYGYGNGTYKRFDNSQKTASSKFNQYGISLAYSPYYSKLSVESSIEYEINDLADYIYIPVGFRITFGKKLRPFVECSGYYSILMKSNSEEYIMKNDYGARLGLGLMYAIDKRWRIEAGYYRRYGFGSPLNEKIQIPVNTYTLEKNRFSSYNIELAVKYRF
jgi:hypothetical protein